MEECPLCSGRLAEAKVTVEISGVELGEFDGLRCQRCQEQFLLPNSMDLAHAVALSKNLFGILKAPEIVPTVPQSSLASELRSTSTVSYPTSTSGSFVSGEVEIITIRTGPPVRPIQQCATE
mgnify:CR=1 FL=1